MTNSRWVQTNFAAWNLWEKQFLHFELNCSSFWSKCNNALCCLWKMIITEHNCCNLTSYQWERNTRFVGGKTKLSFNLAPRPRDFPSTNPRMFTSDSISTPPSVTTAMHVTLLFQYSYWRLINFTNVTVNTSKHDPFVLRMHISTTSVGYKCVPSFSALILNVGGGSRF